MRKDKGHQPKEKKGNFAWLGTGSLSLDQGAWARQKLPREQAGVSMLRGDQGLLHPGNL